MKNANPVSAGMKALAWVLVVGLAGCGAAKTADEPYKTFFDHFTMSLGGHPVSLEVAVTEPEQERGLMERPDLGKDEGMIFVYTSPDKRNYWMKNCPEGLDIAFMDRNCVIMEIYTMIPFDTRGTPSRSDQVQYIVEMPAGWYAANGVRPGATIDRDAVASALKARGFDPTRFGFK